MWTYQHGYISRNPSNRVHQDEDLVFSDDDFALPSDVQGAAMAEALNVHEATGLTPAQLQARVAELEGALEGAITQTDKLGGNSLVYRHIRWGTP